MGCPVCIMYIYMYVCMYVYVCVQISLFFVLTCVFFIYANAKTEW